MRVLAAILIFLAILFGEAAAQPTAITLTASPSASTAGQQVTLTATVSPAVPGGQVAFYDGTSILGVSNITGGSATYATAQLLSCERSFQARFLGNSSFKGSVSNIFRYQAAARMSCG